MNIPQIDRRAARGASLTIIAVLIIAAAVVSFAESYRGLLDWSAHHGLSDGWQYIAPLMVDTFVAVGELTLFVLVLDGFTELTDLWPGWAIAGVGLLLSAAGNVGHLPQQWHAPAADMITAGVPPFAAGGALSVGLYLLKRTLAGPAHDRATLRKTAQPRSEPAQTVPLTGTAQLAQPDRPAVAVEPGKTYRPVVTVHSSDPGSAPDVYWRSVQAGKPISANRLASECFGGNRRAAGRFIAAQQNGNGTHGAQSDSDDSASH